MAYPDRLMAWVSEGDTAIELRFKRTPNLFEEATYTLQHGMHTVMLPRKLMITIPHAIFRYGTIVLDDFRYEGILRVGSEIEVMEVWDKAEGKVKYYGKLPNGDSWILPLKAIPKNIR